MKLCVEHADIRNAGKILFARFDSGQIRRIVERSEGEAFADDVLHFRRDQNRLRDLFSAMENAVPDRGDLRKIFQNADLRIQQFFADLGKSLSMVGNMDDFFAFESVRPFVNQVRGIAADSFHLAAGQNGIFAARHVEECKFERRTSCVHHQNFHVDVSFAHLNL